MPVSNNDRDFMIRTIIGEADDQPDSGKAAVAHVIMNRVKDGSYGATPTNVVLARGQFEPWQTRTKELLNIDPKSDSYRKAAAVVDDVLSGKIADPTSGATHFLDKNIVTRRTGKNPQWAAGVGAPIGDHTFYSPDKEDDLLGSLVAPRASSATTNAPTAAGVAGAPRITVRPAGVGDSAEEDLLGGLVKAAAPSAAAAPQASRAAAPAIPPENETMGQQVSRLLAQNQGDTWSERGARLGLGAVRGIGDVADTIAQGIGAAGETGANALARTGVISPESVGAVHDWRAGINRDIAGQQQAYTQAGGDEGLAGAGRIGGEIAGSAPFLGVAGRAAMLPVNALTRAAPGLAQIAAQPGNALRVAQTALSGAGAGAGASALTSSTSDAPLLDQAKQGGAVGAVLGPLGAGVAKVGSKILGSVDRETAQLAQAARDKYGIKVGAGQISSNPTVRFLDSVLQRLPFTGVGRHTVEQQSALNSALANEMGVSATKITPDVIRTAKRAAYSDYDAAKTTMGPLQLDQKVYQDLHDIHTNAHYALEQKQAELVDKNLRNVFSKIDPNTHTIDADLYQSLTRKNGPLDTAINSKDSKISNAASGIKDALENLVGRNSPALKKLKDEADYKYFVASSVEPLAAEATTGNISPAKLLKAVDFSKTNAGELGRIAKRFMVEPPSSGTAERATILQGLGQLAPGAVGLGGLGAAAYFDPESWQRNAALTAAGVLGGRYALTPALRGRLPANAMIRLGLRPPSVGGSNELVNFGLPAAGALTARRNALSNENP